MGNSTNNDEPKGDPWIMLGFRPKVTLNATSWVKTQAAKAQATWNQGATHGF